MRRRLRKKQHLGEFQEMGFWIHFRPREGCNSGDLLDDFIDAIVGLGLECGGGGIGAWNLFVTRNGRGTTTEGDRAFIEAWLCIHADAVEVGPLMDAWHGWD